ncbi:hypothetical protein [uncultured Flavobacterium sp.]|uniref:hypothetical protein n=1 Tax=uncultured Flavobacterium sp. TaxID=165435 RepID=UPI0030ECF419|tara:strand:+ start:28128 stop:28292 length:165 start_codon:yes stop_codon:yes gene_type:complete
MEGISISNGKVFIDGVQTTDAEFIGYAILDFAQSLEDDGIVIELKEQDVFVENV